MTFRAQYVRSPRSNGFLFNFCARARLTPRPPAMQSGVLYATFVAGVSRNMPPVRRPGGLLRQKKHKNTFAVLSVGNYNGVTPVSASPRNKELHKRYGALLPKAAFLRVLSLLLANVWWSRLYRLLSLCHLYARLDTT